MSDIVTGRIFSNGEVGITATKMNEIISRSVIQPDLIGTKPAASSAGSTDYLLLLKSDGTLAKIAGDAFNTSVANAILPQVDTKIWSARLRSFNAAGNPTFEVDQRNVGTGPSNIANGVFVQDRWLNAKTAPTIAYQGTQAINQVVLLPGTNFRISQSAIAAVLQTQQATLAAADTAFYEQSIEGPLLRELINDVHSLQIVAFTNVAGGLKFSLAIRNPGATQSYVVLCTLTASNVWQTIPFPNIPVFPSAGSWSIAPGTQGYLLDIVFVCGPSYIAPAAGTWQNGNFLGAPGMDNFGAKPVGSNLLIGFIQHEPGSQCTTPMDKPWQQNYDECLRYYQKTYEYGTAVGTVTTVGLRALTQPGTANYADGNVPWVKPMAKAPTFTAYNHATGAVNSVQDALGVNHGSVTPSGISSGSIYGIGFATATTSPTLVFFHYAADTGW